MAQLTPVTMLKARGGARSCNEILVCALELYRSHTRRLEALSTWLISLVPEVLVAAQREPFYLFRYLAARPPSLLNSYFTLA